MKLGRKRINPPLKRLKCNNYRLPQWIVNWIGKQSESGGRLIEKAIIAYYKLKNPYEKKEKK